jgi:hypothetical protein
MGYRPRCGRYFAARIGGKKLEILVRLFNKVKEGKDLPTYWKIAIVWPIFKGKVKIRELGNYRGIALLSALGKIYSGMLAGGLRDWLVNNRILSKFHAGFVINKRTTDNIFVIKSIIILHGSISQKTPLNKSIIDKYLKVKRGRIY